MSEGVIDCFHSTARRVVQSCLPFLVFAMLPFLAVGAENPPFVVSYTQIRKPSQFIPRSGVTLPNEFSQYPFSVYHVYTGDNASELEPVICISGDAVSAWTALAKEQDWVSVEIDDLTCFVKAGSSLDGAADAHHTIRDHLRYSPTSVASGGLMGDWKAFLKHIQYSADSKQAFLESALPFLKGRTESLGGYDLWLLEELSKIEKLVWEVDPSLGPGTFAVSITTEEGSRLSRLLSHSTGDPPKMFGFVPKNASYLNLGWLHGTNANNYFNHFFRATADLEDETFQDIRSKLNALDAGIFDRWDGSWAQWSPKGSEDRLLLLGGRFQASDLTDLFAVLAEVPLSGLSAYLELDTDNSVVGFTRTRSLRWVDEGEPSVIGELIPNQVYLGIANGFLIISESETAIMEHIFTLNSRRPLKESALQLLEERKGFSLREYKAGELTWTVALLRGRLVYRQDSIPDWFYSFFGKTTKDLAN